MYNKIEEQLGRTLNPMESMKLDELVQTYSINEIVECIRKFPNKHLNYYITVLKNQPKQKRATEWLDREIINEPIDEETKKEYQDFLKYLEEFRNG